MNGLVVEPNKLDLHMLLNGRLKKGSLNAIEKYQGTIYGISTYAMASPKTPILHLCPEPENYYDQIMHVKIQYNVRTSYAICTKLVYKVGLQNNMCT